jgi:hypothetical protein
LEGKTMKYITKTNYTICKFSFLFLLLLACTCNGATMAITPQSTIPSTEIIGNTEVVTEQLVKSTNTPTKVIVQPTNTEDKPFDLIGIWKTEDMRAPDKSWSITYPIYLEFTNKKQTVYHGIDTFNKKIATDEGELVYLNPNDSIFIKKIIRIPGNPEYLGKFQKWTWTISNGKVLFTIFSTLDSQEQAMKDNTVSALASGVKMK